MTQGAASAALTVLLATLALGVLGMHALMAPGVGHHAPSPSMGAAMLPDASEAYEQSPSGSDPAIHALHQAHDHDALTFCGVMLASAGIAWLLIGLLHDARRRWRLIGLQVTASFRCLSWPQRARGLSPPSVLAHSVIRC